MGARLAHSAAHDRPTTGGLAQYQHREIAPALGHLISHLLRYSIGRNNRSRCSQALQRSVIQPLIPDSDATKITKYLKSARPLSEIKIASVDVHQIGIGCH